MALKAGYKGYRKLAGALKESYPGILSTDDNILVKNFLTRAEFDMLGAVNIADMSKSDIGTAWNGNINSARARLIIPCKSNTTYTMQIYGTNDLDFIGYITSPTVIPSATSINQITSFPVTFKSGENDQYIIMGFNKTSISISDIQPLSLVVVTGDILPDAYIDYAMTNQELTGSAIDQKTAINAIITAATGAADFAAFKTAMGAITPVTRSIAAPDTRSEVEEPETKTTRSTKKTTTIKEGE